MARGLHTDDYRTNQSGDTLRAADVKLEDASKLKWDDFVGKSAQVALPGIYDHATQTSQKARNWYWTSIKAKRQNSVGARAFSYALAVIGVAFPLIAAAQNDARDKLLLTQIGVTAIAVAGLVQLCDNIFGWSSGWLRYVTTVTAMEKLTLQFLLDWAGYCFGKSALGDDDKKPLFDLARAFELEIEKRRAEETDGWVAEFNRGMAALNEMIKSQKDATEKAAATAKSELESKTQAVRPGAIEINIAQSSPPKAVNVFLDDAQNGTGFSGPNWAATGVAPGQHKVRVQLQDASAEATKIADVPAGGVSRLDFRLA